MSLIDDLKEKRNKAAAEVNRYLDLAASNGDKLKPSEAVALREATSDLDMIEERIARMESAAAGHEANARAHRNLGLTNATVTHRSSYGPGSDHSFILDSVRSQMGDLDARDRVNGFLAEKRTTVNTFGTTGSDFAFPDYLVNDFIAYARPGRVIANTIRNEVLPAGRDTLIVPSITGGSTVEPLATEGGQISNTLIQQSSVSSPVVTIAGSQLVAQQLFDLSPANIDRIVMQDLAADFAKKIEGQVVFGSGDNGNLLGLLTSTNTNSVTYTATTATAAGVFTKVAEAATLVNENRFAPATAVFMTPRRWAWLSQSVDQAGRPLVVPTDSGAINAMATSTSLGAGGPVGFMHSMPVYVSNLIPQNLGTSTNEDRVIVARAEDIELWESAPRFELFPQPYAQNMAVLARFYTYAGLVQRYPKAVAVIGGSGMKSPDFA